MCARVRGVAQYVYVMTDRFARVRGGRRLVFNLREAGGGAPRGPAAAAAAAAQRRREEEEEHMTPYTPRDLTENWEFKILRSATGAFKDPAVMQRYLAEEAQAGWTLV